MGRVYITHCNEKYLPVAYGLVESIREFSEIPIIVYCLNVLKKDTYKFQKLKNVYVEYLNIGDSGDVEYQESKSGNFYVNRSALNTYEILSAKVMAMEHALNSGWDEICYLDSDCLATPIVDEVFLWSDKITSYPLGTKGIHDYMILQENGKQRGNPFETTWPNADNTKCLEWPLMNFMGMKPEERGVYATTGIMIMNQKCLDFVTTWNELVKIIPRITKTSYVAPYHEETLYNVLRWKIGNDFLPLNYINIWDGLNTVVDFYGKDTLEETQLVNEHENNPDTHFYKIPEKKLNVKVLHGEKREQEIKKIIQYLVGLKERGYYN